MQDIQLMQQLALLHSAEPVEQSELDAHLGQRAYWFTEGMTILRGMRGGGGGFPKSQPKKLSG